MPPDGGSTEHKRPARIGRPLVCRNLSARRGARIAKGIVLHSERFGNRLAPSRRPTCGKSPRPAAYLASATHRFRQAIRVRFVSDSLRCRIRDHGIRPDDVALPPTSVAPPRLVTQIRGVLDASRFTSSDGSPCRHRWSCRGTNEKPGRVQRRDRAFKLPLQGSNLDSPDPESGVLPVTPRGRKTWS